VCDADRGAGAVVGEVAAHLLRTMPPSFNTEPLIGVTEQVQHLKALVADQDVGVVSLHGPAGIGKTTLAQAFADEEARVATFQRRIWLHVGQDAQHGVLQDR